MCQASAPYDSAAREDKSRSKMLHRILVSDKESFLAGGLPKSREIFPPLHAHGEPFMDAFANPLLVRGVPESSQEMRNSTLVQKPLFVRQLDRPFFTRSGGNKSAVLPNDLFEVIAEAEETGGTAQRNLGVSTRFGISDSCDNRLPGSTIPVPPPRVSSTMRTKRMYVVSPTHFSLSVIFSNILSASCCSLTTHSIIHAHPLNFSSIKCTLYPLTRSFTRSACHPLS